MAVANSEITNLQNQTSWNNALSKLNGTQQASSTTDSNVFLTLMLQQLQNQDPTQPTDNTEWLAQLAQYSSLEQMTQMNSGLTNCMDYIKALYSDMSTNSEINQTLSLIGKEVTIKDSSDDANGREIVGTVTEASFEEGTGKVKIGDNYYSIGDIISVRDSIN